jgi:hypothetical protein
VSWNKKGERILMNDIPTVEGRKHDPRCAESKKKKCICACKGKYHGIKSGVQATGKDGKPLYKMAGPKTYFGTYDKAEHEWEVLVTNGHDTLSLNARLDLMNHSPSGFAWGYGGSGPAQLALALLADVMENADGALKLYGKFKWEKIAKIPMEASWSMTDAEIKSWIESQKLEAMV